MKHFHKENQIKHKSKSPWISKGLRKPLKRKQCLNEKFFQQRSGKKDDKYNNIRKHV